MALTAYSEDCQDVAAALLKFKEPVSEAATEITALVSELYAICSALLELDTAQRDRPRYRLRVEVEEDQRIVLRSLDYTFKDIKRLFGSLGKPFYRTNREAYIGVWKSINRYFMEQSRNTLVHRLEYYRLFLLGLVRNVSGYEADRGMDDLRYRIEKLLRLQEEDQLENAIGDMTLGAPRVPSWERIRPWGLEPQANVPPSPLEIRRISMPISFDYDAYGFPPVPEAPLSPTMTTATTSTRSSRHGSKTSEHWIYDVFRQGRPSTSFRLTGSESKCHGENMPHAASGLSEEYDELLELPFESGYVKMRIFLRPSDRRARLLCVMERSGRRIRSSHPVTYLRIVRSDSCLQICLPGSRGELILWTNLRFPSYERLVLFHCTFLSLKAQDLANPIRELQDHFLHEEVSVFKAEIIDDGWSHALQILKDMNSDGLRLQASALRGQLKKTPIWTAFINYKIAAKNWIWLAEPYKVHIGDLDRYVFCDDYVPQLGFRGEHEICFRDARDAEAFMATVEDLAVGRI